MEDKRIKGKLIFYSETGTEGGYWAFQDEKYISFVPPAFGVSNGSKVCDINDKNRIGIASETEVFLNDNWLQFPDPINKDPDYLISSLYCGEENGDLSADKRLMDKFGFKIKYAEQRLDEEYGVNNWRIDGKLPRVILKDGTRLHFGGTPSTVPSRPYGIPQNGLTRVTVNWDDGQVENFRKSDSLLIRRFDLNGLHVLKNGDKLKIIHPDKDKVIWQGEIDLKSYPVFKESANGAWIHADQKGISREEWSQFFFDCYPAEIEFKNEKIDKELHTTRNIANGGGSANSSIFARIKHFFGG